MSDTFGRWGEYLEYIDQENKLIEKRNAKQLKMCEEDNKKQRQAIDKVNTEIEKRNEARKAKYDTQWKAYRDTPWYKIAPNPPMIWSREYTMSSTGLWYMPILEPLKKPTIEEYLTWELK